MFIDYLASILPRAHSDFPKDVWKRFNDKIDSYVNGDLDHAVDTMTLLWKLSKGRGSAPSRRPDEDKVSNASPLTSSSTVTNLGTHLQQEPTPASANWECIEIALIKSIREGTFFDKRYWTRQSKTARALRPVYLSTIIVGGYLQRIMTASHMVSLVLEFPH